MKEIHKQVYIQVWNHGTKLKKMADEATNIFFYFGPNQKMKIIKNQIAILLRSDQEIEMVRNR